MVQSGADVAGFARQRPMLDGSRAALTTSIARSKQTLCQSSSQATLRNRFGAKLNCSQVRRAADSANDLQKLPKCHSSGQRVLLTLWREISNTLKTLVLDWERFAINAGADGCDLLSSFLVR
jgi:hypothetical protein